MRLRLFQIVQRAQNNDQVSRWYDFFIVTVAFVSIVPLMFKTEHISPELDIFLNFLDIVTVFVLFSDYVFRWITYDIKSGLGKRAFWVYPFTPMAIIDLLSILPSVTILHDSFKFLRILRIVRILRMFNGLTIMTNVFIRERKALLSIVFFMCVYVLSVGLIMFTIEPSTFDTFLDALYWSTTALATIGYGDITPLSDFGKFIAIVSSLIGIAIVAFPAGIVTGGYITQLQKAREKGREYFAQPIKHDKIFKGKQITKYKSLASYLKANKKVKYYAFWIFIGTAISLVTTVYMEYEPNSILFFDEYGAILISLILEPCAGLVVALINDVLYSVYTGSTSGILSFACGAMYVCVFGLYFRRGKKITPKAIIMVVLVCLVFNFIYYSFMVVFLYPNAVLEITVDNSPIDRINFISGMLGVDINIAYTIYYFVMRAVYCIFCLISVILIRQLFWGSKLDPMLKIPIRKRYKHKIYKRAKNEHSYIQVWLEENSAEDEDIPEFDEVVKHGKKSIEKSKKSVQQKKEELVEMQKDLQEKIQDILQTREDIAKTEEVIDIKRRAVKRVKRRKRIEQSDIIPDFVAPNLAVDSSMEINKDAPGADTVGQTGSFEPIKVDQKEKPHHAKSKKK